MTATDYIKNITEIQSILRENAKKLRAPTPEEERRNQRRASRFMLLSACCMVIAILLAAGSAFFGNPTIRAVCRGAMVFALAGAAFSMIGTVAREIWRTRKQFVAPVQEQWDTILATLPGESEVVAELLRHNESELKLVADRLDYEVSKVTARVSVLLDVKSVTFVTLVAYVYSIFTFVKGTGLLQMSISTAGTLMLTGWYLAALYTKGTLGVLEYQGKLLRLAANLKGASSKVVVAGE